MRRIAMCQALAVLLVLACAEGTSQPEPFQISVKVDLIVVHATVRNRNGATVSNLRQEDFAVYEDGVRQTLRLFRNEDLPITVGLVVDHSGSMRPKIADVLTAARTFARASNPNDQMFVVNFNEVPGFGLPAAVLFTNRAEELEAAVASAPITGQTALYDAIALALERLETSDREKKALVVISDGGDNASKRGLGSALQLAERSNALVYTIGIFEEGAPDKNPEALRKFALSTGGDAYFPREIPDVIAVCERIALDIRNQYTLGYVSDAAARRSKRSQYRRITVDVRGGGNYSVRARKGYSAADEPIKVPNPK